MSATNQGFGAEGLRTRLRRNWGWLLALGIVMELLGVIGLGMSVALTIVTVIWFGALMLVGGVVQLVDAFREKSWGGFGLHLVIAVLYVVAGAWVFFEPAIAAISLTLILAMALIAVGVLRILMALQLRPMAGWPLVLLSGLISMLLGVMILAGWPSSGLVILGLFVAIELIMQGMTCITLAIAARAAV